MGRGSNYPYTYKMLIDDDDFYYTEEEEGGEILFDDGAWSMFLDDILEAFDAYRPSYKWMGYDVRLVGETDRARICIDSSGGLPCLFLQPKTYYPFGYSMERDEKEYVLTQDAKKGFNRLIKQYPNIFRYATSCWTSAPYTKRYV